MSWNHRVLAHQNKDEISLDIHEVYYNKNGVPNGYTENPISVSGDTLKSVKWVLNRMKECTKKPILWAGDKFPQEYK